MKREDYISWDDYFMGVAILAEAKAEACEPGDAATLTPNYLRLSQAERERAEKMAKPQTT